MITRMHAKRVAGAGAVLGCIGAALSIGGATVASGVAAAGAGTFAAGAAMGLGVVLLIASAAMFLKLGGEGAADG